MTIIEPSKNHILGSSLAYFIGLLILCVIAGIYFYNLNVNLKYEVSMNSKAIQQLESTNADLRNQMYKMLDAKNLTAIIQKQNLIQDKNPDYFERAIFANR